MLRVRARVILVLARHTLEMSQHRAWCFTLNNYTEEEYKSLQDVECKYIIMGKEEGKEETPHLQGYIQFKNAKRMGGMKDINGRAHWEAAKGNPQQNIEYCSKDGDFWEKGPRPKNGKRTVAERIAMNKKLQTESLQSLVDNGDINIKEVRALKNARYDLSIEKKAKRRPAACGVWIHGPFGTGKTHWAEEQIQKLTGEEPYRKNQNKWWDGYTGQKGVLLDDLCKDNHLEQYLKLWLDKYPVTGQPKNGHIPLHHDVFFITSQYTPEEIWPNNPEDAAAIRDRCQVIDFRRIYNGPSRRQQPVFIDMAQYPEIEADIRPIGHGDEYQP